VLGVDVGRHSTRFLRVGDDVEAERCLAARFGTVDLGDAAAWDSADADRGVEVDRAGGDRIHSNARISASHLHDCALAVILLDLGDRQVQRLLLVFLHRLRSHLITYG
jgi:hypothetical protein